MSGPSTSPTSSLPPRPNLEQYRKQSKDLLKALRARDSTAASRLSRSHPRFYDSAPGAILDAPLKLSDAQLVVAREHGFASWPKFKRYLEAAARDGGAWCRPYHTDIEFFEGRAFGLHSMFETGERRALRIIREFHPRYAGMSDEEIRGSEFTLEDARLVAAREHGVGDWAALGRHVEALAKGEAAEPFVAAFQAIEKGNTAAVRRLIREHRDLVNARGTNGNTLLNLATACGRIEIARLLLKAGADVDLANNKGFTPLHAAAYAGPHSGNGAAVELLKLYLDAGASIDICSHGDGGTPLVMALFWGHRPQAEILAERGIVPNNLRVAAGLGRVDLIESFFNPDGSLKPQAGAHREFHRPHSGFPPWIPSDDRQEILDEALVWACMSGRMEALEPLVRHGANVNSDPYRGTPLTRAIWKRHLDVAQWLIDHGADVNQRATFGGTQHGVGVTALHIAAQNSDMDSVRFLVERGADATIQDDLYRGTPAGWAEHFGHTAVTEYLRRTTDHGR